MLYLFFFSYIGVQRDFHIRWCSCRVTLIHTTSQTGTAYPFGAHESTPFLFFLVLFLPFRFTASSNLSYTFTHGNN